MAADFSFDPDPFEGAEHSFDGAEQTRFRARVRQG
jgi:hypothetical protein